MAMLIALSVGVVFGALVLSIDAGQAWLARRTLVTGADAVALAAAAGYAEGDGTLSCGASALADLLDENAPDARIESCSPRATGSSSGYVTVQVRSAPFEGGFRAALGIGDPTVSAASSAMWTPPTDLRPIGLCIENVHVRGWLGTGADGGDHPAPGVHRIRRGGINGSGDERVRNCPVPGADDAPQWEFLDPSGSGTPDDLADWLIHGYPGIVAPGDCDGDGHSDAGCAEFDYPPPDAPEDALAELRDVGTRVPVVIFDEVSSLGNEDMFRVQGFIGVVVEGFSIQGPPPQQWLDVRFHAIPEREAYSLRLCDVSGDPSSADTNCSPTSTDTEVSG